ncbi:hypothetical protein B0H13DRAFT_1926529 [Mycena leptocephala]|nr:hypothetical protein B0H13DRAFT_1926529 [Mycena leptocephala]
MASSSSPRSVDHSDDEDDYGTLMSTVSPNTSPTVSRKRNGDHLDTDDDNLPLPSLDLALRANGNHVGAITAFATRKRLRPEQMTALEVFMADPIPVQLGKIFALGLATDNTLAKFQAAKPPFEINSALKTNITRAVNAMLCSSKASQYKGETGKNDVQSLLIRHRWGNFVIGTEHDKAAMDVILKFIGETYTQSRSIIKKERLEEEAHPSLRPKEAHTTIYQLTKLIVQKLSGGKGVSIPVSAALCSRVALMRKWHLKKLENSIKNTDTDDYWELVDLDLQAIRTKAREGTVDPAEIAKRVARAFASILDKDRKRHGSNPNEEIPKQPRSPMTVQFRIKPTLTKHSMPGTGDTISRPHRTWRIAGRARKTPRFIPVYSFALNPDFLFAAHDCSKMLRLDWKMYIFALTR